MKTGKRARLRGLLATVMTLAMCVGLVPTTAFAAETASITAGKTSLTVASSSSGDNTSVVAFGGYEWYVIGYNGTGVQSTENSVTLLAKDDQFGNSAFRASAYSEETEGYTKYSGDSWYYANNPDGSTWTTPNEYAGSTLQTAMNAIAEKFSTAEQSLIIAKDLNDVNVTSQEVWALSGDEWDEIGNSAVRKYGDRFWLRSPYPGSGYDAWLGDSDGVYRFYYYVIFDLSAVRPALSLNLTSVIFTSAAEGGKSATVGSVVGASAPTTGTIKYTFQSSSQQLEAAAVRETDSGLVLDYSGATTGSKQYVSFVLKDSTGSVVYYGKIADSSSSRSGEGVSIPLTGVADGSYTLSIFSEQANDDLYSDFASEPIETAIEVKDSKANLKRYTVEVPVSVEVKQGGSVAAPAESFTIKADIEMEGITDEQQAIIDSDVTVEISGSPIETTGEGTYEEKATVKLTFTERAYHAVVADAGLTIWQTEGSTDGWKYDSSKYRAGIGMDSAGTGYEVSEYSVSTDTEAVPLEPEEVLFTNTYTKDNTGGGDGETTPETKKYTITASAGTGGTITPTGSTAVTEGSSQTFTIAANDGYKISDVKVDGVSQGAITSYTFTDVQAAHTIEAVFEKTEATNPTDPTNPTTPTEDNKTNPDTGKETSDTKAPQTGDSSSLALWIGLLVLAAAGLIGTAIYGRKRKYSK